MTSSLPERSPQSVALPAINGSSSRLRRVPAQDGCGTSIPTLVAFTTTSAIMPGSSFSSSADQRRDERHEAVRPRHTSTWAATPSLITWVTMPWK